jgi:flagellar hook assembly protein FlgD
MHVKVEIYNVLGQRLSTLVDERLSSGHHTFTWDGSNVASGMYLYRVQTGDFVQTKKMILQK